MSETRGRGKDAYTTEIRCGGCGRLMATRDGEGIVRIGSVPVMAFAALCPECGEAVPLMAWSGLEISLLAAEQITRSMDSIKANGGFGTFIMRFQKGKARFVGLGECLADVG